VGRRESDMTPSTHDVSADDLNLPSTLTYAASIYSHKLHSNPMIMYASIPIFGFRDSSVRTMHYGSIYGCCWANGRNESCSIGFFHPHTQTSASAEAFTANGDMFTEADLGKGAVEQG
jgi:hypothetical protein